MKTTNLGMWQVTLLKTECGPAGPQFTTLAAGDLLGSASSRNVVYRDRDQAQGGVLHGDTLCEGCKSAL